MIVQRSSFSSLSKSLHHNSLVWHPIIVGCHVVFIGGFVALLFTQQLTAAEQVYILITIGLYLGSTAYHMRGEIPISPAASSETTTAAMRSDEQEQSVQKNQLLRQLDQIGISAYIHGTPLPFVAHSPLALTMLAISFSYSLYLKLWKQESGFMAESSLFFLQGVLAFGLCITVGLPALSVDQQMMTGILLGVATACFVGKLLIYRSQKLRLIKGVWETPETGHMVLSWGVMIHTYNVIVTIGG